MWRRAASARGAGGGGGGGGGAARWARRAAAIALCATAALAAQPPASFDCAYRQLALDYGASLQPFRPAASWSQMADALTGAQEAQNCSLSLPAAPANASRFSYLPLPAAGTPNVYYIAAAGGADSNPGTQAAPFATVERGLAAARAGAPTPGTLVLRGGTYFLAAPLVLTAADAHLTVQGFPGEEAWLSGGRPLAGLQWRPYNTTPAPVWNGPFVGVSDVHALMPGPHVRILPAVASAEDCEAACKGSGAWACTAYTWHDQNQGSYRLMCYLRNDGVWAPTQEAGHFSGYLSPVLNVWQAAAGGGNVTGLRHADGSRATRARYPNGSPETVGFSSSLYAKSWTCNGCGSNTLQPDYQYTNVSVLRNTSAAGWFQHPQSGVGGHCSVFSPPAGYWCGNSTMGGGAFTYRVPSAMTVDKSVLPHLPYANPAGAVVQTWRPGHWASWMLETASVQQDAEGNFTFEFSRGGFQGGRGANYGGEIYVEGVLEELDAPDEWHYDAATGTLYWNFNASGAVAAPPSQVVVTNLQSLVRITGTPAAPVVGVTFAGLGLRDTAYSYLEPHGMPSGGDWALRRDGAVFLEGTQGTTLDGLVLERLDGNAVMISGWNRGASVTRCEFAWIGDTAIASWGYTDSADATYRALAPGMGEDGTAGEQPWGSNVSFNLVREIGVWEKQSSFVFQAVTAGNHYEGNVAFNGPRAGINFNDGFMGGSNITRNIIFNMCRESSDHGVFNSWDRQVYLWLDDAGSPTTIKKLDNIERNMFIADYHSMEGVDNDDGSCYYHTHHNFFYLGQHGMKSDFGGHDNHHDNNVYAYISQSAMCNGYDGSMEQMLDGHEDSFFNNTIVMLNDGDYAKPICSGEGASLVGGNTIFSPTGAINECGMSVQAWQAAGHDAGTVVVGRLPTDQELLAAGKRALGLQ